MAMAAVLLMLTLYFIYQNKYGRYKNIFSYKIGNNIWEDIMIKDEKIGNMSSKCLNRSVWASDFKYQFEIDPSDKDNTQYTLVVGANTALGRNLVKRLISKGKNVIPMDGIVDFDISVIGSAIPKGKLNIEKAIICVQSPLHRGTIADPTTYEINRASLVLKQLCEYFVKEKIGFIIAMQPPYIYSFIDVAAWFEAPLIMVPFLPKMSGVNDLEHPLVRAAAECSVNGTANIEKYTGYDIHSIKPKEISDFLINHQTKGRRIFERIISTNTLDIETTAKELFPKCKITFTARYNSRETEMRKAKLIIMGKKVNGMKMIKKDFNKHKERDMNSTYLSIVVPHSPELKLSNLQRMINFLSLSLKVIPIARVELIIVDSTPNHKLKSDLEIPSNIKINIIENNIENTTLFKAYNIGIKASLGYYILILDPSLIIPTKVLEYAAGEHFKPGVLYRTVQMDVKAEYAQRLSDQDLFELTNTVWKQEQNMDVAPHCYDSFSGSSILTHPNHFSPRRVCAASSFALASRGLWAAIGGLPEVSESENDDRDGALLASFMKLRGGFVIHFLPEPSLHPNEPGASEATVMARPGRFREEMICYGRSLK